MGIGVSWELGMGENNKEEGKEEQKEKKRGGAYLVWIEVRVPWHFGVREEVLVALGGDGRR